MTRAHYNSSASGPDTPSPRHNGWWQRWIAELAFDPRSLAAFRIGLAAILLFDLATRVSDLSGLYTDGGAVPRELVLAESSPPLPFRILFASGTPAGMLLLLLPLAIAALALGLGRATRIAAFVCWLGWCALMARNPYVVNFGDRILRLILFWSMFLPLDGAWTLRAGERNDAARPLSMGMLAYTLQVVFIYFFGALHKDDPVWWSGEAVQMTLHLDLLTRPLGEALSAWPVPMQALTWATLLLEFVIVWGVVSPVRTAACRMFTVTAFVAFHLGLAATLRLGHFPAVCIVAWIPFLPAAFWDRLGLAPSKNATPVGVVMRGWDIGVAALLALVFAVNVQTLRHRDAPLFGEPFESLVLHLGLDQRWTMFAPHPTRADGWLVAAGQQRDGRIVDVWGGEGDVTYEKPADPGARMRNERWMSYTVKLYGQRDQSAQKEALTKFLCRRWNERHPPETHIDFIALDFVQELTLPGGYEDDPIRVPLTRHRCSGP